MATSSVFISRAIRSRPRFDLKRLLILFAIVCAYFAAYKLTPRSLIRDGARITHLRVFARDFQPYFFAPAGVFEATSTRIFPTLWWSGHECGQDVILQTDHVSLRFRGKNSPPPRDHPLGDEADILTFQTEIEDPDLKTAEEFLRDKFPRPYTVPKVSEWYEDATDELTRINLLRVLAASQDPRAALVLASAMRSKLRVRIEAASLLRTYFLPPCSGGGDTGSSFAYGFDWLEENAGRLFEEARHLPPFGSRTSRASSRAR